MAMLKENNKEDPTEALAKITVPKAKSPSKMQRNNSFNAKIASSWRDTGLITVDLTPGKK